MGIRSIIKLCTLGLGTMLYHNDKSKILFYHDIYEGDRNTDMGTTLEIFKRHVATIYSEGYEIVPQITKPNRQVTIMLDDGFKGIYRVKDYFLREKIFPTIFLAVELIGKEGYLTKEEILELQNLGFNFECHSWSHQDLTLWNEKELERELGESKEYLGKLLGKEVTELCLPIGYFSDFLLSQVARYNYNKIYSSIPGSYFDLVNGSLVTRNLVQYSSPQEVRYVLRGGGELIKSRYERMHYKH